MTLLIPFNDPRTLFAAIILTAGIAMTGYGAYDYVHQSNTLDDAASIPAIVTGMQRGNPAVHGGEESRLLDCATAAAGDEQG